MLHSNLVHNRNWSVIFRRQKTAKSLQCFSAFCLLHMYGTWLPLPEMTAISTMLKLTANVEFYKFLHFTVQVEADLQHLINGLNECAAFSELICLDWL